MATAVLIIISGADRDCVSCGRMRGVQLWLSRTWPLTLFPAMNDSQLKGLAF